MQSQQRRASRQKKTMSALRSLSTAFLLLAAVTVMAVAQPAPQTPVSYASVTQVNNLLANLQQSSQAVAADLTKTRVDKWKTDSNTKRQADSDVQSVLRNVQDALPGLVDQVRNSPEDLAATFKLYHNLDALHDVLVSIAESAGAFGPREQYQQLANDANNLDNVRRDLATRLQDLAAAKEAELARLRTALSAAQAAAAAPPKKIVIDDSEPEKPVKKKKAKPAKPPATAPTNTQQAPNPTPQQPSQPH